MDLVARFISGGNDDGALALLYDLFQSLRCEQPMLALRKVHFGRFQVAFIECGAGTNTICNPSDRFTVTAKSDLLFLVVAAKIDFSPVCHFEEVGAAAANERINVGRRYLNFLTCAGGPFRDDALDHSLCLVSHRCRPSDSDGDQALCFIGGTNGRRIHRTRCIMTIGSWSGEIVTTRNINTCRRLIANLLEVGA